ncbi:MAG: hypothetical protein SNH73_05230 [Rikenellaceae bacterium]
MKRLLLLLLLSVVSTLAQSKDLRGEDKSTYIDSKGVVRYKGSKDEMVAFGVNYSAPFSYWKFRELIGADQYQAIDEDVYHLARLGLDGFRIHVWDCYISDEEGNLVENEHLKLYDYMHYKFKEHGFKLYITPINHFTDNGGGFTSKYGGKMGCLSNPATFPIMAKYLQQFVNHVNPYTGIAYKDDPSIVAFELMNEPSHWQAPELITECIDVLYDAVRAAGCDKPLLYNVTTTASNIDSVFESKAEGGSFQWYPTGLTTNHDMKGNFLPFVDQYYIPFDKELKENKMPRFIYEFSPADVGSSAALYPAMARSFREAGFQFAAKFAYDPLHAAYCNIEYKTHYLNAVYTPQKAMGMMIAAEVFHEVSLNESFGRYPDNNTFGSCSIDPTGQRSEFISASKYLYTNGTQSEPLDVNTLEKIAGVGSSQVVTYSGNGIYILDKLESGVWRLELFPDAFWVDDPYFTPKIEREVAVAISREQQMSISLSDLGCDFTIEGLNEGNSVVSRAEESAFAVKPGVYLLSKSGVASAWSAESSWQHIKLGDYYAPSRKMDRTYVLNETSSEILAGQAKEVFVDVLSEQPPLAVNLQVFTQNGGFKSYPMSASGAYEYSVELPTEITDRTQVITYHVQVQESDGRYSVFPRQNGDKSVLPVNVYADDACLAANCYQLSVIEESHPIYLFSASDDYNKVLKKHRKDKLLYSPSLSYGGRRVDLSSRSKVGDNVVSLYCGDRVASRASGITSHRYIEIYGEALDSSCDKLNLTLILRDGSSYGASVMVSDTLDIYRVPLSALQPVEYVLHPLPYPEFRPDKYISPKMTSFDPSEIEKIQIGVVRDGEDHRSIGVEWIRLN